MADTTPISNKLNLNLAIRLNDGIASTGDPGVDAATDGKIFLDTTRNKYIIQACRWLIDQLVLKFGVDGATPLLQGVIRAQPITFVSTGVPIRKDFLYPSRLLQSANQFDYIASRSDAVSDILSFKNYVYTIDDGKLFAWIRTTGTLTLQSSGTATFYYIASPRVATGSVASVTVTSGGSGYVSAPTVTFDAPTSGTRALGTATLSGGAVASVTVTQSGDGYTSVPAITFSSGAATATAAMNDTTAVGTDIAVNATPDLALDARFHDAITAYAEYLGDKEKGTDWWLGRAKVALDEAVNYLPKA